MALRCWLCLSLGLLAFQACRGAEIPIPLPSEADPTWRVREVRSCRELAYGMNDTAVDLVLLKRDGLFNCTEADWPGQVVIDNRTLHVWGEGPDPIWIDVNKMATNHTVVRNGAARLDRNMWNDHSILPVSPYASFSKLEDHGTSVMQHGQLSDAACVDVRQSPGIQTMLTAMRIMQMLKGGFKYDLLDNRTAHINDSGWLEFFHPRGARWRLIDFNLTCTGNITHPLPDDFTIVEVSRLTAKQRALAVLGAVGALVAAVVAVGYARKGRGSGLPEYKIAETKGFVLEAPLGSGHFGRVYRARNKATGQSKSSTCCPGQRREAAAAWRECQLLSTLQHDCVVRTITFYAARVERKHSVVESAPGNQYVEVGFDVMQLLDQEDRGLSNDMGSCTRGAAGSSSAGAALSSNQGEVRRACGAARKAAGLSSSPTPACDCPPAASGPMWCSAAVWVHALLANLPWDTPLQVQLVMQYCDMGTLDAAIKEGVFKDPKTGLPNLRHILLTAAEIARGLQYLHHPDRRLVHRDLTATNVLLATHSDERGFRALLSDFGISTVLTGRSNPQNDYMSPEVFMHDDISPALDIYSLGIILHYMWAGSDPYGSQSPAMVILAKVRPSDASLPALRDCPTAFQQLVWDCTAHERQYRPSAGEVVKQLEALLDGMGA
ncbi:hypothetical protein ABPG77_005614 [Micractinium sp. CCAP 211/92]